MMSHTHPLNSTLLEALFFLLLVVTIGKADDSVGPESLYNKTCDPVLYEKYSLLVPYKKLLKGQDALEELINRTKSNRKDVDESLLKKACSFKQESSSGSYGLECVEKRCVCPTSDAFSRLNADWSDVLKRCVSPNGAWCAANSHVAYVGISICADGGQCQQVSKKESDAQSCRHGLTGVCVGGSGAELDPKPDCSGGSHRVFPSVLLFIAYYSIRASYLV